MAKEYTCKGSKGDTIGKFISKYQEMFFGIETKDILLRSSYGLEYRNRGLGLFDYGLNEGSHRLEVCNINTVNPGMVYVSKAKEIKETNQGLFKFDGNGFMYYKI